MKKEITKIVATDRKNRKDGYTKTEITMKPVACDKPAKQLKPAGKVQKVTKNFNFNLNIRF